MKLPLNSDRIVHANGSISAPYPVADARAISGVIVVLFDYMAFPKGFPAQNVFACSATTGEQLWRAESIDLGETDAYISFLSETPLVVGNFTGFDCQLDLGTGKATNKCFTK